MTPPIAFAAPDPIPNYLRFPPAEEPELEAKLAELNRLARTKGWRAALDEVYGDDDIVGYVTAPERASFIDMLPITPESEVLEIGPGLGQLTCALARRARSVSALEVVPGQAEFAAERCRQEGLTNVSLTVGGDDCRLPYGGASFDIVVLNLVFEWCGSRCLDQPHIDAQRRLLEEIHWVLKPGGKLYLATKNRYSLHYMIGKPDEHHFGMPFGSALPRGLSRFLLGLRGHHRAGGMLHSYDGLATMLREAGFHKLSSFWAAPEMRYPTQYVSTDPASIRAARRKPNLIQGDKRSTRFLMSLVPAPLVKYLTPGLAFLATKPR